MAGYLMDVTPMDLEERMALIAGRDHVMPARSRCANAAALLAAEPVGIPPGAGHQYRRTGSVAVAAECQVAWVHRPLAALMMALLECAAGPLNPDRHAAEGSGAAPVTPSPMKLPGRRGTEVERF